ncbi:MAG: RNA-binding protein [Oscillospiraceae bacterium]|jgi:RNA-binding protein YlmH|nr:RNA-binding protein [Oscillospiraceae bacterium]
MEQKDLLLGHLEDLAGKAIKTGCAASRFLTPAEQRDAALHFRHGRGRKGIVDITFDGGFEEAERTRAVFLNSDYAKRTLGVGECDWDTLFAALKIEWRPQDTLGHRDILGAIMALGIERDTIGDIICEDRCATLVCLPEMSGYIAENLTKAGRVSVSVSAIGLNALPVRHEDLTLITDTVASLRLDAVLSAAFGLSRTKAAELIESDRVSLNHQPCLQSAKELTEGALLSVRGLGRAKLLEVGGTSKKGRIFVKIGLYGR